jgi:hypothetical protein
MFDESTLAQVPVELTGDPAAPVRLRPGADDDYRVGTSPSGAATTTMVAAATTSSAAKPQPVGGFSPTAECARQRTGCPPRRRLRIPSFDSEPAKGG